jgi:hypothetical protein
MTNTKRTSDEAIIARWFPFPVEIKLVGIGSFIIYVDAKHETHARAIIYSCKPVGVLCTLQINKQEKSMKHIHAAKIMRFAKMVEAGHPIEYATQSRENEHRQWVQDPEPTWRTDWEYRVALAFVEGKPVFESDTLYLKGGLPLVISSVSEKYGDILHHNHGSTEIAKLTWNKPEPTVRVSELLRRVADAMEGAVLADCPIFSYTIQDPHMVEVTIGTHHEIN